MNFMIWSPQNLPAHVRPLHHQPLCRVLEILEVKPSLSANISESRYKKIFKLNKANDSQLWDYLETARNNYRRLIRQHHPDRGGSHDFAATLTAAWSRVKELFKRRGFELA